MRRRAMLSGLEPGTSYYLTWRDDRWVAEPLTPNSAQGERDVNLFASAVRAVDQHLDDDPDRLEVRAHAADLLYEVWTLGIAHGVGPDQWPHATSLPAAVVDALAQNRDG